jgi:hypothetical protein
MAVRGVHSRPLTSGRLGDEYVRVADRAAVVSPAAVAKSGFAVIGLLGVMGVLHLALKPRLHQFDLDAEDVVPAAWSALLLVAASAAALANGLISKRNIARRWYVVGAFFFFMSFDEFDGLHEKLEGRTGIDWETLYIPIFLLAAVAGLMLLARLRATIPNAAPLFLGGAVCWAVAQVLERFEWDGHTKLSYYNVKMVPEELLEMSGSLLFVLAALVAYRAVRRPG